MTWGQWMVVEFSVEEELRIENQSRSALHCQDTEQLARLCASLVKQNAYYTKLISQATGHIAELEMITMFGDNIKSQCVSDDLNQTHQGDIQVRNPFVITLLIVLGFVVDVAEFCFGLLQPVKKARSPKNRG
jgi:hypothetical protein